MGLIKETTIAGDTVFERVFRSRPRPVPGLPRVKHGNPSSDSVRDMNDRNAERNLAIKINHNFRDGDLHFALTYGDAPDLEAAKKYLGKFQRAAVREYRKLGIAVKYITATEWQNKRIHHHVIITKGLSLEQLQKLWPHGKIRFCDWLHGGDYRRLAYYLVKETARRIKPEEIKGKRRYNCSRSITMPETRREPATRDEAENPKAPSGWYIDKESVFEGINPVTGQSYIEYVLKPSAPNRDYKRRKDYRQAKTTKPKPLQHRAWLRDNYEYQTDLF